MKLKRVETVEKPVPTIDRSKLGRRSKAKGGNFERTVAKIMQEAFGIELVRTPQSGGFAKKSEKAKDFRGDITTLDETVEFKLHVEIKNCKVWSLTSWFNQAENDCPKGRTPIVVFHEHNTSNNYVLLEEVKFIWLSKGGSSLVGVETKSLGYKTIQEVLHLSAKKVPQGVTPLVVFDDLKANRKFVALSLTDFLSLINNDKVVERLIE